ncbi:MAG: HTTM domain-containing protein [Planctomycetota bacterium]
MRPDQVTILVIVAAAIALLVWKRRDAAAVLRSYFRESTAPVNLAVFRIVVFGMLLYLQIDYRAEWFARVPESLRVMPKGWSPIWSIVPWNPGFVNAMQMICIGACIASVLGFFTRTATIIATVTGLYVFGLQQLFGKLNHFHHLFWFAALIAASPSGDALSIDAWRRGTRAGPARCYALPLRITWLLLGMCYFFPGLWKLWLSGPEWFGGTNLKFLMHSVWYGDSGFRPIVRVDEHRWLLMLGGIGTLAFELSFIFLVLFPRTRWIAVAMGLGFHTLTGLTLNIWFVGLTSCYVSFINWAPRATGEAIPHTRRPAFAVGAVLLFCNGVCGLLAVDSWPFAVYPTFAHAGSPQKLEIEVRYYDREGVLIEFDDAPVARRFHYSRWSHVKYRIARTQDERLVRGCVELLAREIPELDRAAAVQVDRVVVWTDPARLAENPRRRDTILRMQLDGRVAAAPAR